jgi:alpha-beta hydrolase superfamily lysophospholipase
MDRLNAELDKLTVPTFVFHGGDDQIVPTDASEPLGELEVCERKVYEGLRHETLNEPEGPRVIGDIVVWLNAHL